MVAGGGGIVMLVSNICGDSGDGMDFHCVFMCGCEVVATGVDEIEMGGVGGGVGVGSDRDFPL